MSIVQRIFTCCFSQSIGIGIDVLFKGILELKKWYRSKN